MASFGLGNSAASADVAILSSVDASTPWIAASEGNIVLLQSALAALNLPMTSADENGYTLLHAASSYNQLEVVKFLLRQFDSDSPNAQSYIHASDNEGDSALHYAGNVEVLQLLVEVCKLNPAQANKQGKTALQAKTDELNELLEDEDTEEDDEDCYVLRQMVEYLSSVTVDGS
jgi:ankyrin repeat protein